MPSGGQLYLGSGGRGPLWAAPEHAALVLGPPRSGKTSAVVVPTVLAADGAVVSTSTKPDVLSVTADVRKRTGLCRLFDPSGTISVPRGVEPVHWSPVRACAQWDDAMLVARALVGSTRTVGAAPSGPYDHWSERAEALLASLLHAAARGGHDMTQVLSWVDRRQGAPALRTLEESSFGVPADLLSGIVATEAREQSGIWSTASGVLSAYRSESALATTRDVDFDPAAFCASRDTLYICATGRHQQLAAPLVVGLLTEIRAAAYARAAALIGTTRSESAPSVVFALDEVANIAPLPDLPAMVSEGGGQGVLTLACLQDLSQARARWGAGADGFLSLFGTTVILPGIGDMATLRAVQDLAGGHEVPTTSTTQAKPEDPWRALMSLGIQMVSGRGAPVGQLRAAPSTTVATRREPRLPLDAVARGHRGMAVVVDEGKRVGWVRLTPWFAEEPWRSMVELARRERPVHERGRVTPGRDDPTPARAPGG
ncbi:MAG: type IV secretory system conjugative DNA transfer family protein [Acidimicrobiales bacterium]